MAEGARVGGVREADTGRNARGGLRQECPPPSPHGAQGPGPPAAGSPHPHFLSGSSGVRRAFLPPDSSPRWTCGRLPHQEETLRP